ncbi:hypothetical protein FPQ18DRAFT_420346 [Pyronema domesticum]|nr:hypothetical protein FPQ18DRAFT_420346 [Pyronema domesticum]
MTDVIEYSRNREYLGQDAVTIAVLTVLSYVFTCMFYIVEAAFYVLDAGFLVAQTSQHYFAKAAQLLALPHPIGNWFVSIERLRDLQRQLFASTYRQFPAAEQLSVAQFWAYAASLSLVYLILRFLFSLATQTYRKSGNHPSLDTNWSRLRHNLISPLSALRHSIERPLPRTNLLSTILNGLALPIYLLLRVGYTGLPPRKPHESLILRYLSITLLTPLWISGAVLAVMVMFVLSTIAKYFGRSLRDIFGHRSPTKHIEWHPLSEERQSNGRNGDITKPTEARVNGEQEWDELRRDREALVRERDKLEAERRTWAEECARAKEERREFEVERERFQEEQTKFRLEQRRWSEERKACIEARKEAELMLKDVEAVLKSVVSKSRKNRELIAGLKLKDKKDKERQILVPLTNLGARPA